MISAARCSGNYFFRPARYLARFPSGVVASAGATGISPGNPFFARSINQVTKTKAEVKTGMPVGSKKMPSEAHTRAVTSTPMTV